MATLADLLVRISADVAELLDGLKRAEGSVQQFAERVDATTSVTTRMALATAAAGSTILAALGGTARAAAHAQEEVARLNAAIAASGKAIDASRVLQLATHLQRIAGISDETSLAAARLLIQFGATEAQVVRLLPILAALQRAQGIDMQTAAALFGRALTGMETGLSRVLGKLGEGVSLSEDFDAAAARLEQRLRGQLGVATLTTALGRLAGAISDVAEEAGKPVLQPLIDGLTAAARAVEAIRDIVQTLPGAMRLLTTFATVLGLVATTAGALAVAKAKLLPLLARFAGVTAAAGAAADTLAARTLLTAAALRALSLAGRLAGIAGLITVLLQWRETIAAVNAAFAALETAVVRFAAGLALVIHGMLTFNAAPVQRGLQQLIEGFGDAARAARDEFAEALRRVRGSQDDVRQGVQQATGELARHRQTLEELRAEYERTAAAARLFAAQAELAATREAIRQLQRPGLTVEDLRAIEARRQEAIRQAAITELEQRRRAQQRLVDEAKRLEDDARAKAARASEREREDALKALQAATDRRIKLEQEVTQTTLQLEQQRLAGVQETSRAVAEAARDEAEARLGFTQRAVQAELDILRQRVEATRDIEAARTRAEDEQRQARLALLRLGEETRLAMLRRTVDAAVSIGQEIVRAQDALFAAQRTRATAQFLREEAERQQLVRFGLLTARQAADEAAAARQRLQRRELEDRLAALRTEQRMAEEALRLQVGLAEAEAASKRTLLAAEVDARRASIQAQARLRELDLQAAIQVAKAETQAKVAELRAQLQARAAVAEAEARAALTPEEREARLRAVAALRAGEQRAQAALLEGMVAKERALTEQLTVLRQQTAEQLLQVDQETAVRRAQIEQDLQLQLVRIAQDALQQRSSLLQRAAALEADATQAFLRRQQQLTAQFAREPEIVAQLTSPLARLMDQAKALVAEQETVVQSSLQHLVTVYEQFAARVTAILQTIPRTLDQLLRQLATTPMPALAAPGVGALPGAKIITVEKRVETHLTVEGTLDRHVLTRFVVDIVDGELRRRKATQPTR